jgi:formate dehydrogenase maturation protein FdhE
VHLPDTYEPFQIDTMTGNVPRKPILSHGGLSFYCPCCSEVPWPPMVKERDGENGLTIFRCPRCPTILTATRVKGFSR